ncbi:MAG: NADPH-dependent F420 reductase [Alphaproteobacteria bacterium]
MTSEENSLPSLAVLGGTGAEGGGLALRLAHAGYPVIIGSRTVERAREAAAALNARLGTDRIAHGTNLEAAETADIALLTVPYAAQMAVAREVAPLLDGKILIDATVPLVPPKVARVQLPEGGSAVAALQSELGPGVRVVSAFQNVSAHLLAELDRDIDCDVLVCGDDVAAREAVIALAEAAGLRGWHAGPLVNAVAADALTSVLISINRTYRIEGAGIRITGTPKRKN